MPVNTDNIEALFSSNGARFEVPIQEIAARLDKLSSLILDWDGVFNDGIKGNDQGSTFSEVDSMGLNMFRFSFYLKHGFIPAIFIVTGENNQASLQLSKREHFNGVYIKFSNKLRALEHIEKTYQIKKEDSGFVFDDILDLGMAANVGLRFFIKRDSNPLLNNYVAHNNLSEYITANSGGQHAVREVCELSIGLLGNYDEVVQDRVNYSANYKAYLSERNSIDTQYFTLINDQIESYSTF